MALEKGLREVGGQLVYDKAWHCSFCRRRYRARHLIEFWGKIVRRSGEVKYTKEVVRLCRGDEKVPKGCAEMGFQRLLFKAKRQTRYAPRKAA